jgi:predicted transposase YbfD/YdcC
MDATSVSPAQARTFYARLKTELNDPRDNRGKRHELSFVVCAVGLAILAGRATLSSIQRYIVHKIEWLRESLDQPTAQPISRAHLPRLLAGVDREDLSHLVEDHFSTRLGAADVPGWTAVDGKTLRGTTRESDKQGERILTAVDHASRATVAQQAFEGQKASEITTARDLLADTGLDHGQVTLDALHLQPKTTAQIHLAGGRFLIQAKDNQETLRQQLAEVAATTPPLGRLKIVGKGHGRLVVRRAAWWEVSDFAFDLRWADSGFRTLIALERTVTQQATQKTTQETAYYLSNEPVDPTSQASPHLLAVAIQQHWGVESENWIRDVTLREDRVKTKDGRLAQVMAILRTLALQVLRRANLPNFQAALETFADCPNQLLATLRRARFL